MAKKQPQEPFRLTKTPGRLIDKQEDKIVNEE